MKKIVIIVLVLVAGLIAYNFATTGTLTLIPGSGSSSEEQSVQALEDRFDTAKTEFAQAHRAAAVGGVDSTSGAEAARREVQHIAEELKQLRGRLSEPDAVRRADRLADSLDEFGRQLR